MSKKLIMLIAVILAILTNFVYSQQSVAKDYTKETKLEKDRRMQWWREARFGMFIHWGLYAIPAGKWENKKIKGLGEWIMNEAQIAVSDYEKLAPKFNPIKFDADQWVQIAKDAGMKYIVITSKHHDGFCLWDSKVGDYDIIDSSPYKKDILDALYEACKKQGIALCFYHSIMDWHHEDYLPRKKWDDRSADSADFERYVAYMKQQLKELIEKYEPPVLWFDGEWEDSWTHERGVELYNYVRSLKPDIIINNRVDKGRQGLQGMTKKGGFIGDFGTPEQEIPARGLKDVDWESCMTMNDTWGYKDYDKNWKSSRMLIRNLVDITSKGGNYLLNVGPTAEGLIPAASVERLKEIGKWMKINSESIYDTTASPFEALAWGRCTKRVSKNETTVYLHIFDWPTDNKLELPGIKNTPIKAYPLADKNNKLRTALGDRGLTVTLPKEPDNNIDTVIKLIFKDLTL